jgi:hypothetical protein
MGVSDRPHNLESPELPLILEDLKNLVIALANGSLNPMNTSLDSINACADLMSA